MSTKAIILKALAFFALLLVVGAVHAQAACPPGMVPYGTGNDLSACGYSNQQQQAPPQHQREQWTSRWGAIAANAQGSVIGVAADSVNKDAAEEAALADCQNRGGGNTCSIVRWYANQCISIVTGGKIYNTSGGTNVAEATQKGMKLCTPVANNCHVYYSACSYPVRVQ